jgi:hypothetical protein
VVINRDPYFILCTWLAVLKFWECSKCSVGGSTGEDNGWRAVLRSSFGPVYYPWRKCRPHW